MNNKIINHFENLIQDYNIKQEPNFKFKIKTCNNVISIIKKINYDLTSSEQLKDIKGIGKKTLEKIDNLLTNTELNTNLNTESNNIDNSITEIRKLMNITGIGPSKAKKLIENNINFNDLIKAYKNQDTNILTQLTHHQILGLKYYDDLNFKIPRNIIDLFDNILKKKFNYNYKICGSYRREKTESGDIDVLICNNNKETLKLKTIVDELTKYNILIDNLTMSGNTKYMGFAKIDMYKYAVRIDIRLISIKSYPFAILYFTGSKKINTIMRNKAIKLNYKLNEYGLYDKNNNFVENLNNEKDIFEFLKLDYIEPFNRN